MLNRNDKILRIKRIEEENNMKCDILIIGAGPAGIFTALELLKKESRKQIIIVEKGKAIE